MACWITLREISHKVMAFRAFTWLSLWKALEDIQLITHPSPPTDSPVLVLEISEPQASSATEQLSDTNICGVQPTPASELPSVTLKCLLCSALLTWQKAVTMTAVILVLIQKKINAPTVQAQVHLRKYSFSRIPEPPASSISSSSFHLTWCAVPVASHVQQCKERHILLCTHTGIQHVVNVCVSEEWWIWSLKKISFQK